MTADSEKTADKKGALDFRIAMLLLLKPNTNAPQSSNQYLKAHGKAKYMVSFNFRNNFFRCPRSSQSSGFETGAPAPTGTGPGKKPGPALQMCEIKSSGLGSPSNPQSQNPKP